MLGVDHMDSDECDLLHELEVIDDIENNEAMQKLKEIGSGLGIHQNKEVKLGLRKQSMAVANE